MNDSRRGELLTAAGAAFSKLEARTLLAADLSAVNIETDRTNVLQGEEIPVTVEFENTGDTDAAFFRINVWLTDDETLGDEDDILLTQIRRVSGLGSGEDDSATRTVEIPDDLEDGDYALAFEVDSSSVVNENSEDNNEFISDEILTVGEDDDGDPDLQVRGRGVVITDGDTTPSFSDNTAFGNLNSANGSRTRVFQIRNIGDDELQIEDIEITGAGASSFTIVNNPEDSIEPGEQTTLRIRFDPDSAGFKRATVVITSNDADDGEYTFHISGRGEASDANITVSGLLPITDGDDNASFLDGTHIGVREVGEFRDRTFTITNTGGAPLNISDVTISGRNTNHFSVQDLPDTTIEPGESSTFTIRFSPVSPGTKKVTVNILSDDPDTGTFNFEVRGRGRP